MIWGVAPGTALYAAAVLSFAAAMSLDIFAVGKLKGAMLERTDGAREVAYLPFVTLLKMAVAIAPKRRRAVPASPAAVPLFEFVSIRSLDIERYILTCLLDAEYQTRLRLENSR
jgi:hypothetical protein